MIFQIIFCLVMFFLYSIFAVVSGSWMMTKFNPWWGYTKHGYTRVPTYKRPLNTDEKFSLFCIWLFYPFFLLGFLFWFLCRSGIKFFWHNVICLPGRLADKLWMREKKANS